MGYISVVYSLLTKDTADGAKWVGSDARFYYTQCLTTNHKKKGCMEDSPSLVCFQIKGIPIKANAASALLEAVQSDPCLSP